MVMSVDGFATLPFIVRDALAFESWIQTWESNEIEVYYHGIFEDDQDNLWIRGDDDWCEVYREVLPNRPVEVRLTHTRFPTTKFLNDIFGDVESESFMDELANYLYIGECVVWHTFKVLTLPHPFNANVDVMEHLSTETMGAMTYTGEWHTQQIDKLDDVFEFNSVAPSTPLNFNLVANLHGNIANLEKITYYPKLNLLEQAITTVLTHYDIEQPAISITFDQWIAISDIPLPGLIMAKSEILAPLLREYNKLEPWLPLFTNGAIELYPNTHNFTSEDEDQCMKLWFMTQRRWSCFTSIYEQVKGLLVQLVEMELDKSRKLIRIPLSSYDNLEPMDRNMIDDFIIKGVNYYYMTIEITELPHESISPTTD